MVNSKQKGARGERKIREVWKDIKEYEGLYMISNLGRVKSLSRNTVKEHIMSQNENQNYKYVQLFKNGIGKRKSIHRLVATAFIDNPNNYNVINHIDGTRNNNISSNLEWCTQSHNVKHSYKIGSAKPTNERVVIRSDGKIFKSMNEAARELKTTNKKIWKICNGEQKQFNGYGFSYYEEVKNENK